MMTVEEMRAMFDAIPDRGDIESGHVLTDVLEELNRKTIARELREFLARAEPIERQIREQNLTEGPETRELWQPLRAPWRRLRQRFQLLRDLLENERDGLPLAWYNAPAGTRIYGTNRLAKRAISYPVRISDRIAGGMCNRRSSIAVAFYVPVIDALVCIPSDQITGRPRYGLAPGAAIYREVST